MTNSLWIAPGDDFRRTAAIRVEVFCDEQGYTMDVEMDEWDAVSHHLLIVFDGEDAATGRLTPKEKGVFKLGRIAVRKVFRSKNLGLLVMKELIKQAEDLGATQLWISAQTQVIPFYEKCGFDVCSEEYLDGHVPHVDMTRSL